MYLLIVLTIFGNIFVQFCAVHSARIPVDNKPRASSDLWPTLDKGQPLIVAHRGEKVLLPEHTIGSYEIASIEGADFVEPDLVLTKDGTLVCFHDLSVGDGTDVASHPEFEQYRKNFTNIVGGINQTIFNDWFIHDFDLAELKLLRVTQAVRGIRPQLFNTIFTIPTFEEYLDVVHKVSYLLNRTIGVIPELKNPEFHNSLWSANYMEDKVLNTLRDYGYPIKQGDIPRCTHVNNMEIVSIECGPAIIQSFEFDSIKYLNTQTDIDLLVLVNAYDFDLLTYNGLKDIASVAQHFHLSKELLYTGVEAAIQRYNMSASVDREHIASLGGFIPPNEIVKEGHNLNLKIGLYTIYDSRENTNRGCDIECEPHDATSKERELFYYFDMGVDAVFVENVQEAIALRTKYDYNLQIAELTNAAGNLATPWVMLCTLPLLPMIVYKQFIL